MNNVNTKKGTRMRIGELFKITRLAKGIKQFVLAEEAGISVSALARFEGGKLGLSNDTLLRISPHLDINPEYVIGASKCPFKSEKKGLIKYFIQKYHFHDDPILAMIRGCSDYLEFYSLSPHLSILERIRHLNIADQPTYSLLVRDGFSNLYIFRCKSNRDFMTWDDVHISRDIYFMKVTNKHGLYAKVNINKDLYEKIAQWDDLCVGNFETLIMESNKSEGFNSINKEEEADIINELREHNIDFNTAKQSIGLISDIRKHNMDIEEVRTFLRRHYGW